MPRVSVLPLAGCPLFRAFCCDELGYIKVIEAKTDGGAPEVVSRWGEARKAEAASCSDSITTAEFNLLGVGKKNGTVSLIDTKTGAVKAHLSKLDLGIESKENIPIAGIKLLSDKNSSKIIVLTCTVNGTMSLHYLRENGTELKLESEAVPLSLLKSTTSIVTSVTVDSTNSAVAVGGKGFECGVWDILSQTQTWAAKPPKPDKLGLIPSPHTCSLTFCNDFDPRKVAVGTAEHTLRIYDVAAQRRPVLVLPFGEAPVTALDTPGTGFSLFLGNGVGDLAEIDVRTGKQVAAFKGGQAGSIRSIRVHPSLPIMASGGLDRYFRVHSTESKKLLGKVFVKQPLTSVLFESEEVGKSEAAEEESNGPVYSTVRSDKENDVGDVEDEEGKDCDAAAVKEEQRESSKKGTGKKIKNGENSEVRRSKRLRSIG